EQQGGSAPGTMRNRTLWEGPVADTPHPLGVVDGWGFGIPCRGS
ncbi:unnamed protein product, partial [marine sediment metagenome]